MKEFAPLSKFFPLRLIPILIGLLSSREAKKKVTKVVSICQNGEKNLEVYPYILSEDDKIQICTWNVFATTIKMSV